MNKGGGGALLSPAPTARIMGVTAILQGQFHSARNLKIKHYYWTAAFLYHWVPSRVPSVSRERARQGQ